MIPLVVTASVRGQISLPGGPIALDALLMAATALRNAMPAPPPFQRIEIPIAIEPAGRFHLASFSIGMLTDFDLRYISRRAPVEQYQTIGPQTGRVQITSGPEKSYRIPLEVGHVEGERLTWYCLGDPEPIAELLQWIPYLGKKRSVGLGRVSEWRVEQCEPWGDGFPVVRDGLPLRTLPLDWPGLASDAPTGYRVLGCVDGPYWQHDREQLSACP